MNHKDQVSALIEDALIPMKEGVARRDAIQTKVVNACPHCKSPIRHETAQFTEFTCGAGFEHAPEGIQRWECAEGQRQHTEDLAVDDEINRRREHRHFEPDHFGR